MLCQGVWLKHYLLARFALISFLWIPTIAYLRVPFDFLRHFLQVALDRSAVTSMSDVI